jgi:hypothetical protein
MLIVTAGMAIYPLPRTKSSALVEPLQKAGKPGFCVMFQAETRQYWKFGKTSVE